MASVLFYAVLTGLLVFVILTLVQYGFHSIQSCQNHTNRRSPIVHLDTSSSSSSDDAFSDDDE